MRDYAGIIRWTAERFGPAQTRIYKQTLLLALAALKAGPTATGVRPRADLGPGIFVLHVAREGRKGRHLIVFRISGDNTIDVLRLLHDGMDLPGHFSR